MFTRLELVAVGPHDHAILDLSPTGRTDVYGPSECGKSYLVEGVCDTIGGAGSDGKPLPVESIRDGADRREGIVTTATGAVLRRTCTRSGSVTRTITRADGSVEKYASDEKLRAALRGLGNPDLRYALAPFAWRRLTVDGARPLRDLLLRYLPPADLRAEVARLMAPAVLRRDDPLDGKGAENARRDANRRRDEAAGRLASARERVAEAAPAPTVTPEALSAARETVAAGERWERHTAAWKRWLDGVQSRGLAITARDDWRIRRDAIPAAPTDAESNAADARTRDTEAAQTLAYDALRNAEQARDKAAAALACVVTDEPSRAARATLAAAEKALSLVPADDTCPTCGQPWAEARAQRAAETERIEALRRAATEAEAGAADRLAARRAGEQAALDAATAEVERLAAEAESDDAKYDAARVASDALRDRRTEHAAALRALGPEPTVPPEAPEPTAPAGAQPTAEALAAAEHTIATAAREAGAAEAAAIAARNATAAVGRETAAHAAAEAEAARLDALVQAVRKAPSELARRQSEALGDLGPVSLLWGDGTAASPAVSVLCDKRPMERPYCATGRQIIGDLWLRRALRRVMGAPWLPLFVDEAQSAAGQTWPEVEGPVVYLWTTADGELRSVVTEAAEAA